VAVCTPSSVPLPPVSVEAERSILGAILLDNVCYTQAASLIRPDDFSLDSHRRIYQHTRALAETGRPIDYVTLTEELARNKELDAIGGVAYLTSLTDGLPRIQNIEHYVRIVHEKAMRRRLMHQAEALQLAACDSGTPLEELRTRTVALSDALDQAEPVSLKAVTATELLTAVVRPREMILEPFLPTQGLAMLHGPRGTGKTLTLLAAAVAVATGNRLRVGRLPNRAVCCTWTEKCRRPRFSNASRRLSPVPKVLTWTPAICGSSPPTCRNGLSQTWRWPRARR
jgi:hypothetical protein